MSGLVLVTGAAGAGPGPAGRRVAGLLLDPGVPVRAFAPTQDHRAEQPRQPGAEVAGADLREIADVESWGAGNNRAASTATASGFPDSDAPLEGSGGGVVGARSTGCRCRRAAARPPRGGTTGPATHPGLVPSAPAWSRASAWCGRTCGSPGPARPAAAGAQHDGRADGRDGEFPCPAGPGQFSGVADDAARHGGDPGQAGGDVSGAWPAVAGAQVRIEIPSARAGASARARSRSACSSRHAARETRVRTRRSRRPASTRPLTSPAHRAGRVQGTGRRGGADGPVVKQLGGGVDHPGAAVGASGHGPDSTLDYV